jgi:hypothetical protein
MSFCRPVMGATAEIASPFLVPGLKDYIVYDIKLSCITIEFYAMFLLV